MTARAEPEDRRHGWRGQHWERLSGQQHTAEREERSAPAVGKQPEVADARKPAGQDVVEKTLQELFMRQRHDPALAMVRIVLPEEGHVSVSDVDQAMIRDSDPMCVAGQIMQHVFWPAEGLFGVYNPVVAE